MKYINIEEAVQIHHFIINTMQGLKGYNETNLGYLHSALEQIRNDEFYPHFLDKLTHLMFSCIKFHPFNDANKRTSIALAMAFLHLNGKKIENFAQYMEDKVIKVAENSLSKDDLRKVLQNFLHGKDKQ